MDEHSGLISIVEDDAIMRRALRRMIESFGYKVELFNSASDYLEASHHDESCLILDIAMPHMGGLELLTTLQESGRSVPTVVLSANLDEACMERSRALGVDFFCKNLVKKWCSLMRSKKPQVERCTQNTTIETARPK